MSGLLRAPDGLAYIQGREVCFMPFEKMYGAPNTGEYSSLPDVVSLQYSFAHPAMAGTGTGPLTITVQPGFDRVAPKPHDDVDTRNQTTLVDTPITIEVLANDEITDFNNFA
jgi:hypothetical protein